MRGFGIPLTRTPQTVLCLEPEPVIPNTSQSLIISSDLNAHLSLHEDMEFSFFSFS